MNTRQLLVMTGVVCVLAGCGSSSSTSESSAPASAGPGADKTVVSLVPAKFKRKGTLTIAADASYPPNEFVGGDGTTVMGMDADLGEALGKVMGLNVDVRNAPFDGIIPGLAAGKYALGMSSFTDTKEREQTVDFVTYFKAGTGFLTPAAESTDFKGLDDLCGHRVSVEKGTTQASDAQGQSKKCRAEGKPMTVTVFPDQTGANLALTSGRADVTMVDSPVGAYQVKQSGGKLKMSSATYGDALYGIAVPKGSGLAKAVLAALEKVMENGRYEAILKKWGISSGAISAPAINGATS